MGQELHVEMRQGNGCLVLEESCVCEKHVADAPRVRADEDPAPQQRHALGNADQRLREANDFLGRVHVQLEPLEETHYECVGSCFEVPDMAHNLMLDAAGHLRLVAWRHGPHEIHLRLLMKERLT